MVPNAGRRRPVTPEEVRRQAVHQPPSASGRPTEVLSEGRGDNAFLGQKGRHISMGGHIKGRILDGHTWRSHPFSLKMGDLSLAAVFDGDLLTTAELKING